MYKNNELGFTPAIKKPMLSRKLTKPTSMPHFKRRQQQNARGKHRNEEFHCLWITYNGHVKFIRI